MCDERLLYGKEFTAEVGEGDTFYGIRFTSGIHRNVKTKEDYLTEKKEAEENVTGIQRFMLRRGRIWRRLKRIFASNINPR